MSTNYPERKGFLILSHIITPGVGFWGFILAILNDIEVKYTLKKAKMGYWNLTFYLILPII